jgi:hypothetical protein
MANNIDLSLLRQYSGEYHPELVAALYMAIESLSDGVIVMPNIKNELNFNKLTIKGGIKPYSGKFAPRAKSGAYTEKTLKVSKVQRDDLVSPSDYLPAYMAKMRGAGESPNNMAIPFEQFFWEMVMKRDATDLIVDQVYWGVDKATIAAFNPLTAYAVNVIVSYTQDNELRYYRTIAATSAGETPDTHPAKWEWAGSRVLGKGFNQLLKDGIASGECKSIATGVITAADAYAQFTSVYRLLAEPIRMGKFGQVEVDCGQLAYEALMDDYENKIKKNFEEVDGVIYLAKTGKNCIIKPRPWLVGSNRIVARVPGEFLIGTDQEADMNTNKVIEDVYDLRVGKSFMWGQLISDFEKTVCNTSE